MSFRNAPSRPLLRWHGGKFRLGPKLLDIFPPHRVYTEVYCGAASVLMQKPRCYSEIINDLDGELLNVFRVLQDRKKAARLEAKLRITPYHRAEFLLSYKQSRSEIERARRTIIRSLMGFGSDSVSRTKASCAGFNTRLSSVMATGFHWNANRSGTTPAHDWKSYPNQIKHFTERLQGVIIEQRPALEILAKMDYADALHYIDPPYPFSGRTSEEHRYRHEMTDADHEQLAAALKKLKGAVIISSYRGPLYDRLFKGWHRIEWTGGQFCSNNSNSQVRTECAWLNPSAFDRMPQRKLFP